MIYIGVLIIDYFYCFIFIENYCKLIKGLKWRFQILYDIIVGNFILKNNTAQKPVIE